MCEYVESYICYGRYQLDHVPVHITHATKVIKISMTSKTHSLIRIVNRERIVNLSN